MFRDFNFQELQEVMVRSQDAFVQFRNTPLQTRAHFLRSIAEGLEQLGDQLLHTAMAETNLPEARLRSERSRTQHQLRSYADACERGDWLECTIDNALQNTPTKPDLRKMQVPIGPVVVFGASNFPLAYSTAGGDTATALAAGCTVVVKAHPAHPKTSHLVADMILNRAAYLNLPEGFFQHVYGQSFEVGRVLVQHPLTAAVGFTGSFAGGRQLFDWAHQRSKPIPVFAEMGSVNPVFLLPEKLASDTAGIAEKLAASITLGVGQFCTSPGLIIGIASTALQQFVHDLGRLIQKTTPAFMLHGGIVAAYKEKKGKALLQEGVHLVAESDQDVKPGQGLPTVATVKGADFLKNPLLHQEIFGPFSLVVQCSNQEELVEIARQIEGQLTTTIWATEEELLQYSVLLNELRQHCGRFVYNGVPTGVEVCLSMHHGGPYPATTDSRFTAVGADAIRRFTRPICYQNWPDQLLPDALKNANPLQLLRRINNVYTRQWLT